MFASMMVPWQDGMAIGRGFNTLLGQVAGRGVKAGAVQPVSGGTGLTTDFSLEIVTSVEDLNRTLGIGAEAKLSYGVFSAEGKFKFSNSVKMNSQLTYLVAKCVVRKAFEQSEDNSLEEEAAAMIARGKLDLFRDRYGDGFIRGQRTGGELYVVLVVASESRSEQTEIAASIKASYGGMFSVAGTLDSSSMSSSSMSKVSVHIHQVGGTGQQSEMSLDVKAVMERMRNFPQVIESNPVPYEALVSSYASIANDLPDIDQLFKYEALEDYWRSLEKIKFLRNEIDFARSDVGRKILGADIDLDCFSKWDQFFADQLTKIGRQAGRCVNGGVDECPFIPVELPNDFRLPRRAAAGADREAVVIFDAPGFNGNSQSLNIGVYDAASSQIIIGNDKLASLKVPSGLAVRLYRHFHGQGDWVDFFSDMSNVGVWTNQASTIVVYEPAKAPSIEKVVVFSEENYTGSYDVCQLGVFKNIGLLATKGGIRSALIPPGIVVDLYAFALWERAKVGEDPDLICANGMTPKFQKISMSSDCISAPPFEFGGVDAVVVAIAVSKAGESLQPVRLGKDVLPPSLRDGGLRIYDVNADLLRPMVSHVLVKK